LAFWPLGPLTFWPLDLSAFWLFGPLLFGHLAFGCLAFPPLKKPFGLLVFWSFGLWVFGPVGLWAFGPLGLWAFYTFGLLAFGPLHDNKNMMGLSEIYTPRGLQCCLSNLTSGRTTVVKVFETRLEPTQGEPLIRL
jgi:hypothetical protein